MLELAEKNVITLISSVICVLTKQTEDICQILQMYLQKKASIKHEKKNILGQFKICLSF